MWNVGFGELAVIAVLGLLIFGPDRLPKAIRSVSAIIRNLRQAAGDASRSLQEASGFDKDDAKGIAKDLAVLNPRSWSASLLSDEPVSGSMGAPANKNNKEPIKGTSGSSTSSSAVTRRDDEPLDPDIP